MRELAPQYAEFQRWLMFWKALCYHKSSWSELTPMLILRAECGNFAIKFKEQFPELTVQRGFISFGPPLYEGERGTEHWWLTQEDGQIVDPTLEQFRAYHLGVPPRYELFEPNTHRIEIGRCVNCGQTIYGLEEEGPKSICDDEVIDGKVEQSCQAEYGRYMERESRRG